MTNQSIQFTNSLQNHVKDFHLAFNHPVASKPTPMTLERLINRATWTGEELIEGLAGSVSNKEDFSKAYYKLLEGLKKAYTKSLNGEFTHSEADKVVAQVDAAVDALYFINGTLVELGVDVEPIFEIVQQANMSKLFIDEDGNKYAQYREDGKIKKNMETFFAPEDKIKEEILRQMSQETLIIQQSIPNGVDKYKEDLEKINKTLPDGVKMYYVEK